MKVADAIDYLRRIQESATVGHYADALAVVLWAAEQYMEEGNDE